MGCLPRLVRNLVATAALVALVYAAWAWGPEYFPEIRDRLGIAPTATPAEPGASPELADSVLARVQDFRGVGEGQMALSGREVTSVLRYAVPGLIPSGIRDPEVSLRDGRVHLSAEVVLGAFPALPDLGPILGILPDTLAVALEASLMPFGPEESALLVHSLEASRIPIPRRLIPEILVAVGRLDRPGLPPEAMAVPLPVGFASAYILTDSLIISSDS